MASKRKRRGAKRPGRKGGGRAKPLQSAAAAPPPPINIHPALAAAALAALVFAAYHPAFWASFVWDDVRLTMAAPIQDWNGIWRLWFEPRAMREYEGHYWPLLYSTFWLEHKLWGFDPLGYHITNLVLHSGVSVVLWRLLLYLKVPGAWLAAAVFAIHPLHVEPALWIIGRKDLLATLFSLAAAHSYFRFAERGNNNGGGAWLYALALLALVAALMCKSIAATLPAAFVLWHWWRGKTRAAHLAPLLPLFAVSAVITYADTTYYQGNEHVDFGRTLLQKLLLAAHALGFHFWKLLWPDNLAVVYPKWEVGAGDVIGWLCAAAALLTVIVLWVWQKRIGRGPLTGVLFFAGTLAPTLGFVDYGYQQFSFVADRYQYLAGAGIIANLAAAAALAWRYWRAEYSPGKAAAVAAAVAPALALLALFGALSAKQARIYETRGTYFQHVLKMNPMARGANHLYANWLREQGRFEEALPYYREALARRPDDFSINNNAGINYYELRRYPEAIAHYQRAIAAKPQDKLPRRNIAIIYTAQQDYAKAMQQYLEVLKVDPNDAAVHAYLGDVYLQMRRVHDALQSYQRALALQPGLPEAQNGYNLARQMLQSQAQ